MGLSGRGRVIAVGVAVAVLALAGVLIALSRRDGGDAEVACRRPAPGSDFAGFGASEIVIRDRAGSHRSCVLTADTPSRQEQGLMRQPDLDGYDGMIFRFAADEPRSFWMRNTPMPLSIAFFNAAGAFVSATDMAPCGDSPQCPTYASGGAATFALEVGQGGLPRVGAVPGSRLTVKP